jgi:hypothetical protein
MACLVPHCPDVAVVGSDRPSKPDRMPVWKARRMPNEDFSVIILFVDMPQCNFRVNVGLNPALLASPVKSQSWLIWIGYLIFLFINLDWIFKFLSSISQPLSFLSVVANIYDSLPQAAGIEQNEVSYSELKLWCEYRRGNDERNQTHIHTHEYRRGNDDEKQEIYRSRSTVDVEN